MAVSQADKVFQDMQKYGPENVNTYETDLSLDELTDELDALLGEEEEEKDDSSDGPFGQPNT
jgi:hypothetical protein